MSNNTTVIKIADIEQRKELMPRSGTSQAVVEDYRASIEYLPPIRVAKDTDGTLVLIDGWHRLEAHKAEGIEEITAIIDENLAPADFFFEAAKANKAHGRRLTADEKRAVSRRLFLQESRDVQEIADATGISERHVRRLVESFSAAKKELAMKKAAVLAKQTNPATGKTYSVREIAAELTEQGYEASKSAVGRWLKGQSEEGQSPKQDMEEIEAVTDEELEEEAPAVKLPKKDRQDPSVFIGDMTNMIGRVNDYTKKCKSLSFSKQSLSKIEQMAGQLEKACSELADTAMNLQLDSE